MKFTIPFTGQYTGHGERLINCYYAKDVSGKNYLTKRPGFASHLTPAAGNIGSAIMVWKGSGAGTSRIAAFGATNSTIYNGTTSLGTITGKARSIAETLVWPDVTVAPTPTLLVPSGDNTAWYYDSVVATMTRITDGSYPGNAGYTTTGDFAVVDGFACIMTTDQKLWASNINSVKNWTANSYDTANAYPDAGIGVVRFGEGQLLAFGTESLQVFQNSGGTPFPFTRIKHLTKVIGAVSSNAISSMGGTVFWVGSTDQGGLSAFQYDGNISRISTPEIDEQMLTALSSASPAASTSYITVATARISGRSFVIIDCSTTTFVYCIEDKRWHEWTATSPLWSKIAAVSAGANLYIYSVSAVSTSGKIFIIDPAAVGYEDNGTTVTSTIISDAQEHDGQMQFFSFLRAIGQKNSGLGTSQLAVSASDEDSATFTSLGTMNLTNTEKRIDRLGAARRRQWKFVHAYNLSFSIEKFAGEMELGS